MNIQQQEISNLELTTEELDGVSGGMRNNETQAWKAFMKGFDKGFRILVNPFQGKTRHRTTVPRVRGDAPRPWALSFNAFGVNRKPNAQLQ